MVKSRERGLDAVFSALGDPTRRSIVARLARGPSSVGNLARPHAMSLPAISKHLSVLERAGLLERTKQGRTVTCTLRPQHLARAHDWIAQQQAFWERQLDRLAAYFEDSANS